MRAVDSISPSTPEITPSLGLQEMSNDTYFEGSNNWALSGTRTASGKPLLCNDPHLQLSLPSIWYEIHLDAPDYH